MLMVTVAADAAWRITPEGGASMPIGKTGDRWQPGYVVGLKSEILCEEQFTYGLRGAFHRWLPDGRDLLRTSGRDLKVERTSGWNVTGSLTALGMFRHMMPMHLHGGMSMEAGLSLNYVRRSDVFAKGVWTQGHTALVREVNLKRQAVVAPGLTIGMNLPLGRHVAVGMRMERVFDNDETTFMALSLVLLGGKM